MGAEIDLVVPANSSVSNAVKIAGFKSAGLITLGTLNGTSGTLQVSADGGTFVPLLRLYDSGTQPLTSAAITIPLQSGQALELPPELFNFNNFTLTLGSTQAAARTFQLVPKVEDEQ